VASLEELNRTVEVGFGRSGLALVVSRGAYAYNITFGLD
jgi:hypothetical protein